MRGKDEREIERERPKRVDVREMEKTAMGPGGRRGPPSELMARWSGRGERLRQ